MNWRFWNRTGGTGGDGCTAMEPLLSLYSDGMASPAEARRVEAHLKGCDGCRQSLGWMQATRRVIAARPAVPPPTDLRARIARAIAEADGIPVPALKVPALPARRPLTLRPALAYGLSFALLAALSGSLFWNGSHQTSTAVHPVRPTRIVVAVNPAKTVKMPAAKVHTQPHSVGPLLAKNDVPAPHVPRVPLFRPHLPSVDDFPGFSSIALGDDADVTPTKHIPAMHPINAVKTSVKAKIHPAAPHATAPTSDNEHLAVRPKADTTAPPKKSPVTVPPTMEANNSIPPSPSVPPEPPVAPRIIPPAVVTPEPRPEVHEASLTDTLRDSVRQWQVHEAALKGRSVTLSNSVVEAAGVSSDRSGMLPAVGHGF